MSDENVEVVRGMLEAFRGQDWAAALDTYHEDAELDQSRMPGGGVYHGHDDIRAFYARWLGSWEKFEANPVELIDAGDEVIVIMKINGIGRTSGAAVTMQAADVYTVAGGRIARHVAYPDASDALEAAGLSE